jgi:hypothetical protein
MLRFFSTKFTRRSERNTAISISNSFAALLKEYKCQARVLVCDDPYTRQITKILSSQTKELWVTNQAITLDRATQLSEYNTQWFAMEHEKLMKTFGQRLRWSGILCFHIDQLPLAFKAIQEMRVRQCVIGLSAKSIDRTKIYKMAKTHSLNCTILENVYNGEFFMVVGYNCY